VAQVGRISGPLLQANLERNGIDLAFRNDLSTTQLLYLDVNNGKIGVNNATPTKELDVLGTTRTTNLIGTTSLSTPGFDITGSTFRVLTGDIYLNANEAIVMANMENGTIRISDNVISTISSNANIDITPNGTGTTEIINDLNVFGDIYTPGSITFGGNITIGDNQGNDTVTFQTDIDTDIIPDQSNQFDLGTPEKKWGDLYTYLINGDIAQLDEFVANGINLNLRPGGIIWVDVNGDDTNVGDSPFGAVQTIAEALSRADASSSQPFTVFVNAGEYQEALPLVVPENVTIIGSDIRNVIVTPDTSSQSEDVFHLNDKTVISNLTIKNHYYDSVNNTGYAFRFAPGAVMSERSPYIQNVTVLTQETSNGAGDAGRGAWIDGAELNAASPNATMLFHSCTFISPGADVINMTNGVRVEWLNSFTYFANRGLYAFNGATGRTSEDGSTVIYGAELRSIGSANVYGTYGAVADGADTLMYLIQHNFAYIGAGTDTTNDLDLVVQANEVVELNNGQIHYVSTDQVGNFRVGDNFFVNFETGQTSINIDTAEIDTLSGLVINSPGGTTVVDGSYITTGNILIDNNTISTNVGDLNLEGSTGTININSDTNVFGSLDIRDNFSFGGTLNIAGDQPGRTTANDRLVFNVQFEQDFNPHQHLTHSLGEVQRPWLNAWLSRLEVGDITFDGNVLTTDVSSANLELRASGTGLIYVPNNNVNITNNLTVDGTTDLQSASFSGLFNSVGTFDQTGNRTATNFNIIGDVDVTRSVQFEEILIDDNVITTTTSNADLEFRASGTGEILIPNNDVSVINDANIDANVSSDNVTVTNIFTSNIFDTGELQVGAVQEPFRYSFNIPVTTPGTYVFAYARQFVGGNSPWWNAAGIYYNGVEVFSYDVYRSDPLDRIILDQSIWPGQSTYGAQGRTFERGTVQYESANWEDGGIYFSRWEVRELGASVAAPNTIFGTVVDADLELRANGTGEIYIPNNNVQIDNNLTVNSNTKLEDGLTGQTFGPELVDNGTFDTNLNGWSQAGGGTATASNGNLRIDATGSARNVSQEITVEVGKTYDFEAQFRSVSNGNPFYLRIFESGVGTLFEWNETSGLVTDQELTFSFVPQTTTIDIIFRAVDTIVEWDNISMFEDEGINTVYTPVQVNVTGNITQTGNTTKTGDVTQTGNTTASGTLTGSNDFITTVITFDQDVISNTQEGLRMSSNSSDPNSLPEIVKAIIAGSTADDYTGQTEKNLINFLNNNNYVDVNNSGSLTTTDYIAYLQYIANGQTTDNLYDDFLKTVIDQIITQEYASPGYFNPVLFEGDYNNPDLEFRAAGTGEVLIPNNNVIVNNDTFASSIIANDIDVNQDLELNEIVITDSIIEIDDNFISTTISNANLELKASENKNVYIPNNSVTIENSLDINTNTNLKGTTFVGNITQTGTRNQTGNLNVIGNVYASTSNIESEIQFDDISFDDNVVATNESNADLELRANGTGVIAIFNNDVQIDNNVSIGTLDAKNINVSTSLSFEEFELSSDIQLFDNVITTTNSNSNLELRTSDNSNIDLQNLIVNNDIISTDTNDININVAGVLNLNSTGAFKVPVGSTAERQVVSNSFRFNNTDSVFEAFNNNNRVISFNGVYSSNRRTSLLAHPTDNTIDVTVQNIQVGTLDSNGLSIHGLDVDDILVNNNSIRTNVSNSPLELRTNGTGDLVIDNISINTNTITNTVDSVFELNNTLYGKVKFASNGAVRIPSGTSAERPPTPEVGMTRWNTENELLEVWDGSTFITAAGTSATLSQEEMDDLVLEYTLIFG
jgi:hypothetical protein